MVEEGIGKMEDNTQEINQNTVETQSHGNWERIFMKNRGQNETLAKCLTGLRKGVLETMPVIMA